MQLLRIRKGEMLKHSVTIHGNRTRPTQRLIPLYRKIDNLLEILVYCTPLMVSHQHCHKKTVVNNAGLAALYSCYLCDDCMRIPVLACLCGTSESARCRPSAWSEKSIMSGCSSASKASCRNNAVCVEQMTVHTQLHGLEKSLTLGLISIQILLQCQCNHALTRGMFRPRAS